ncbi:MAG TPA: protocatechuate 3,4-dioxygenase subunit alpha [Vicinamibacterales bacterium]|jgi:protocatechuate 3,4-dioxygenase alpha subunit|nr:protocatechuate 3,4-dioxygenase subunit alpha [Vicinamibacterales bacterium]
MADEKRLVASPSQTIGPFLHVGFESQVELKTLGSAATIKSAPLHLRIQVLDGVGAPIDDALVEIWQTAPGESDAPSAAVRNWGRCPTDTYGWCAFDTFTPASGVAEDGCRIAAHINICVFARGLLRHVFTRCYFAGDAALAGDPVLGLVPPTRRDTLVARSDGAGWTFQIRMQGADETVFFDL